MPVRQDKSEPTASSARNGAFLCLLFAVFLGALAPATHDWYSPLGWMIAAAGMYLVGSGRIYRPALTRTADAITCRYNPLREGALYVALVILPGVGLAAISSDTAVVRLAGIAAFVMVPIRLVFYLWQGRRGRLRISPDALTVPVPAHRWAATEIPREAILSITAGTSRRYRGDTGPVTQIAYQTADPSSTTPATVLLGPTGSKNTVWLTVEQADLLAALQTWHNSDPLDPDMLDRVEAALRGGPHGATVAPPEPAGTTGSVGSVDYPDLPGSEAAPGYRALPPAGSSGPVDTGARSGAVAGSPAAPPPPSAQPSRWRWLPFAAVGVTLLIGVSAYPTYHSSHRASAPEPTVARPAPRAVADPTGCSAPGAATVSALAKKSGAEPSIYLPLEPGWTELPDTAAANPDAPTVRARIANSAIHESGFTPSIRVDLTSTTETVPAKDIADKLYADLRETMTVSNRSAQTVCDSTVYRADTSGYNPDGKGPQSGTTVLTVVEGTGARRWVAIATIKTRNPDNPTYIAQRDALVGGFHASFP